MTDNRTTELHEVCGDDRFDLIAKAREKLLDSTNIESRPEEVAVLDSILFRCWQMGWLDQLREELRKKPDLVEVVRCRDCKHFTPKGTHKFENGKANADYCKYVRGWMLQITPDGFCAWGERKGDN